MRRIASMVLVAASLLLASTAHANEDGLAEQLTAPRGGTTQTDLAEKHFQDGLMLFKEQKWKLARFEFQASYDLCKSPDLLHNLSVVAERQGLLADAISFDERFLAEKGIQILERERDEYEGRLARLRRQLSAASISSGGTSDALPSIQKKPYRAPLGALALIGIGGAMLAVGIGTGAGALATQQTINEGGNYSARDFQSLMDRGQALNASAITFDALGGAACVAGVVWIVSDRVRHRER